MDAGGAKASGSSSSTASSPGLTRRKPAAASPRRRKTRTGPAGWPGSPLAASVTGTSRGRSGKEPEGTASAGRAASIAWRSSWSRFSSRARSTCLISTRFLAFSFSLCSRFRARARARACHHALMPESQRLAVSERVDCTRSAAATATRPTSTSSAPMKLSWPESSPARSLPSAPPASTGSPRSVRLPAVSCKRPGSASSRIAAPMPWLTRPGISRRRRRRTPVASRRSGATSAVRPRRPTDSAASCAPTVPIQFRVPVEPSATWCSMLGSLGWKLKRLARSSSPRVSMSIPLSSLPFSGDRRALAAFGSALLVATLTAVRLTCCLRVCGVNRHEV